MRRVVATFSTKGQFEHAAATLDRLRLSCEIIPPGPAYTLVGAGALVMEGGARTALARERCEFESSGWVELAGPLGEVPAEAPPAFDEDIFGRSAVMIMARCSVDEAKIRCIAHISGDMTDVFPYLNAETERATFNAAGATFTFMADYRLIVLYPHRIAIAKADDIVDAWRVLEGLRRRVNAVWTRRREIEPSFDVWKRPTALGIFRWLPGTNCGECGFATCLAFAMRVQLGHERVTGCAPVFSGDDKHLKDALEGLCGGRS